MNPLSWITGIFGGQSSTGTINIQTILAVLGVAEAFGVNPAALTPAQMTAIDALLAAMGIAVAAPAKSNA